MSQATSGHGGGHESAPRSGSAGQHDLGRVEHILGALCTMSQRGDAIEHIASMDQEAFAGAFLGGMRATTLHSIAQCFGSLPEDSPLQGLLLTKLSGVPLDKRDLDVSGLQQELGRLVTSTVVATAALAKEIFRRQDSTRYCLKGRHLKQHLPCSHAARVLHDCLSPVQVENKGQSFSTPGCCLAN